MLRNKFGKNKDKEPQSQPQKVGRKQLTWINGSPTIHDVRVLLSEAQTNRGTLCELPIRSSRGVFLLNCQSDNLSSEPCWTLYEGEDGSKQLWSYIDGNTEMITNLVSMSVLDKSSKTEINIPDLAPRADIAAAQAPAPAAPPPPQLDAYAPAPEAWGSAPAPQWPSQPSTDPSSGWPNMGASWGSQPDPMAGTTPGWDATSGGAAWQQQAPAAPVWDQQPQQPFTQPQPPFAQPAPHTPPYEPSPWLNNAPAAKPAVSMESFAQSLDGRTGVTIAELAMDPTLPAACVDAALKLQEMVLTGHFGENVALQALKFAALNNGTLDDGVVSRAKAAAGSDPNELARQGAGLLQHAGVLSELDIAMAEKNLSKHNNSFADSLISSGKTDKLILEASQEAHGLVASGRLRQDQAIIALLYCVRSRTKLSDALQDLSMDVL